MLGQGKNAWQAEIDAAAELADFFSFNVGFAQEIYDKQPTINSPGHHGRTNWRPLEGFVYAVCLPSTSPQSVATSPRLQH